jgi:molybdate transport system substrate-binding protein
MRPVLIVLLILAAAFGLLVTSKYWTDSGPGPVAGTDHAVEDSNPDGAVPRAPTGDGPVVTIFAAASTAAAIDEIGQIYERDVAVDIVVVPAASSVLARQIAQGAPADIFISANTEWANYLIEEGITNPESRRILMTNRLALVAPKTGEWSNEAGSGTVWNPDATLAEQLSTMISLGRLAICEPQNVPCGQYARQTLEALGLWTEARDNLAIGNNAEATLAWIERGEVPGGLVYMTDAVASKNVDLVTFVPDGLHHPILYDAVLLNKSDNHVWEFVKFMNTTLAQRVLMAAGFIPTEIVEINTRSESP